MRIAIVGADAIGSDLLERLSDRPELDVVLIADATSADGFDAVLDGAERPELVFAATTVASRRALGSMLSEAGIRVADLTAAGLGVLVVPAVNLDAVGAEVEISLATPAAQAVVPLVAAVGSITEVLYAEVVTTLASAALGSDARASVDDTLNTTVAALQGPGGARAAKAIVVVNPGEPPAPMRNALFCLVSPDADRVAIARALDSAASALALHVPGFRTVAGPLFEETDDDLLCLSLVVEVTAGVGGSLPSYAGHVELLTRAAVALAERLALAHSVSAT